MKQSKSSIRDSKPLDHSSSYQSNSRVGNTNAPEQSRSLAKQTALDLKKINLNKDPSESSSSLELLILLLYKSLKLSLQQILGLFTNQNKYLAHIVVKGLNDDFSGIIQFYQLINQNIDTLMRLYEEDHEDTFACLYAIKPGFISKDEQVSELTLTLFDNFRGIYSWFVGKEAKCSGTFLLGIRRHQNITEKYVNVLFNLIEGNEVDFFGTHFISSIASSSEFIQISTKIIKFIALHYDKSSQKNSQESVIDLLETNAVFQKWFEIALEFYQRSLDDKLIVIQFFGQLMLYLPQVVEKNSLILNSLRHNWISLKMHIFIPLFNQILIVFEKVANVKSTIAKKLYGVILDIFNDTFEIQDKRQFIVNGFFSILSQFPNIPSDLFIKNFQSNRLNPTDFLLICEAIDISDDEFNLIKIGQILKEIFFVDVITNYYVANLIPEIVKKIVRSEAKEALDFITNLLKNILSNYVAFVMKIKAQPKIGSDQTYFGKKKSSEKSLQQEKTDSTLFNKRADLTIDLCEKIIDVLVESELPQNYLNILKNYILITNSEVKRNNFGMGTKRLSSILQKKLKITKQEEQEFDEDNKQNLSKSGFRLSESLISKKARDTYGAISSLSRVQVPQRVTKQFDEIIAKRKRDEELRVEQEAKKKKEEELKKILYKKELEKMNLIKGGFGDGEAQLKEEGFWNKFVKQTEQIKVYTNDQVEDVHLEAADLIIKKYSKLFKYFFFNYSSTMYSNKVTNFDQNLLRKQTLNAVEIIKFLKDYNLIFPTNLQEIQTLVKEINIKILHRKQVVNELDYEGFEQFIRQFCLCIWNKNQRIVGPQEYSLKMDHLILPEILNNLIDHLKNIFKSKGQNLIFFDVNEPESENLSPELKEMNEKLKQNPNYILPEGYKKITDKKIEFKPSIKNIFNVTQKFKVVHEVLDELIFQKFAFHIIEAHSQKVVKITAKPFHQINVRDRDPTKIKSRALSTIIDRKSISKSSLGNNLTKNDLSKGIKKAMLLLKNEDKIVGQQVAFVLEGILMEISGQNDNKVSLNNLKSLKSVGEIEKRRGLSHRKVESFQKIVLDKVEKTVNLGKDFEKIKNEIMQKKQQKIEEEKRKEEQIQQKLKKKKQQEERYYQQLKQKLEDKKRSQQEQESKKKQVQESKQKRKAAKQKFQDFNSKQVDRLKKEFEEIASRKKKEEEEKEIQNEELEQKKKKIRSKIESEDKMITQIRKETLQAIIEISFSDIFKNLTKEYEVTLKTVFEYMEKLGLNPLALKRCKQGQIDYDTWIKFNKIFELSPLIVSSKDTINIFKAVTKDKRVSKEYLVGLTYEEFLQCLLRECIKQKSVFSKIADRIKDDKPQAPLDAKNKKQKASTTKIEPKNEFEEEQELDVKKLLKEPDVRDDIIDHYGDISKFNVEYFKGLIYYLRMPFTKRGQQKRIKELVQMENKTEVVVSNLEKLKQKLKAEYILERAQPQKKESKPQTKQQTKDSKQQKTETKSTKGQTKQKIQKEDTKSKKSQKK